MPDDTTVSEAKTAANRGNHVRAAILLQHSGKFEEAQNELTRGLLPRLSPLLGLDSPSEVQWMESLAALLPAAASGSWPRAAKCLYELQKITHELRGNLATIDPVEWLATLGRRPVVRTLDRARGVLLVRHLRAAVFQLRRWEHGTPRDRFLALLEERRHHHEHRIHAELAPIVHRALDAAGLQPANFPEQVARNKLVAELIDKACERGSLRIGDLRDALARNRLKLNDLSGPGEWLKGDSLLRADALLAEELDGIYHRGEAYLRGIQRGVSLAFGTRIGRWFSLFLALPFGGAFLAVEFGKYVVLEAKAIHKFLQELLPEDENDAALLQNPLEKIPEPTHHGISFTPESVAITIVLGFFLMGLLHWPTFRRVVFRVVRHVGIGSRILLFDLPARAWNSELVQSVRRNRLVKFLARSLTFPVFLGAAVAVLLVSLGAGPKFTLRWTGICFGIALVAINNPIGRFLQNLVLEIIDDGWKTIRTDLIPGIISWLVWAFREIAGFVERCFYAIDEWFRFREGQTRQLLTVKIALAALWFPVEYLVRFGFQLLLEPQVNPLKHFPVVTVSHKLLLPLTGVIADATGIPLWLAGLLISGVPGVFGFIAWELKENWRLYSANRPDDFRPVSIGHHGESMRGLLVPGFHSGTVPKQLARQRRGKSADALHDVPHAVELFAARELIPFLPNGCRVGTVTLDEKFIEVEILADNHRALRIAFVNEAGTIVGRIIDRGWLPDNPDAKIRSALAVCFALAGATLPEGLGPVPSWSEWQKLWQ